MNVLLIVLVVLAVLVALAWIAGYILSRGVVRAGSGRGTALLGEPAPGDVTESAALLLPIDDKGFGSLRLTATELQFAPGRTAEVLRMPRGDIESAAATADADGTALKRPALVVTRRSGGAWALAVSDVDQWVQRLS